MMSNIATFKMNIKLILKHFYTISASLFGAVAILLAFIDFEEMGISSVFHKMLIFIILLILSFVISVILVVFFF